MMREQKPNQINGYSGLFGRYISNMYKIFCSLHQVILISFVSHEHTNMRLISQMETEKQGQKETNAPTRA